MALAAVAGGVAGLIGTVVSALSASKKAKADKDSSEAALRFKEGKFDRAKLDHMIAYYGASDGIRRFKAMAGPEISNRVFGVKASNPAFSQAQQTNYDRIMAELAKPVSDTRIRGTPQDSARITSAQKKALEAERDALVMAAGGRAGVTGEVDESALMQSGPGLLQKYTTLADQAKGTGEGNIRRYDADTFGLMRKAKDIERTADQYGVQERERINRNSAEALANADGKAQAALMSRGMGASSVLTDALGANARQNQYAKEDALGDLGDRQIRLKTGLQQGTLGVQSARGDGRMGMLTGQQGQDLGLRMGVLNTEQSALTGRVMNPWLDDNPLPYFSNASPAGSAMGVAGPALAGFGSTMFGYGLGGGGGGGGYQPVSQTSGGYAQGGNYSSLNQPVAPNGWNFYGPN